MKKSAALLLILPCLLVAAPASADDESWRAQAALAVGRYIAEQGNAALKEIRAEIVADLGRRLEPLLPEAAAEKPAAEKTESPKL